MGVGLVAVGSGTSLMAKNFAEEWKFGGELYVDPSLEVYKALNCARGVKQMLSLKALKEVKKALGEGYSSGMTQGDGLQLGGCFVLDKQCEVEWQHLEKYMGDHADLEEVLQVCKVGRERLEKK